jgi:hypothetical protein
LANIGQGQGNKNNKKKKAKSGEHTVQDALLHGSLFNSIVPEAMTAIDMVGTSVNGLF